MFIQIDSKTEVVCSGSAPNGFMPSDERVSLDAELILTGLSRYWFRLTLKTSIENAQCEYEFCLSPEAISQLIGVLYRIMCERGKRRGSDISQVIYVLKGSDTRYIVVDYNTRDAYLSFDFVKEGIFCQVVVSHNGNTGGFQRIYKLLSNMYGEYLVRSNSPTTTGYF